MFGNIPIGCGVGRNQVAPGTWLAPRIGSGRLCGRGIGAARGGRICARWVASLPKISGRRGSGASALGRGGAATAGFSGIPFSIWKFFGTFGFLRSWLEGGAGGGVFLHRRYCGVLYDGFGQDVLRSPNSK